ncbi:NAD(P)-dependent oxidoreductase [Maridesulfovibrio bastinii]|uniref:NAD(P)-dependent oxidoreductase n=1 Tax=Maridesulfovibrio bastinii TaxID=47157 RepID=UPI000427D8A8|nr:NAD(P)-dependent oxidoreductase [Maridesulfovibrio bastinii]
MLKILNAEPDRYSRKAFETLKQIAQVDEINLSGSDLLKASSQYDILIVRLRSYISKDFFTPESRMKYLVTATTGIDHVDTRAAEENGTTILNLRGETDFLRTITATSEHTIGLILALLRHIPFAHKSVLENNWNRDLFIGRDLCSQTLGLIGLGRLGSKVAEFAKAFDMKIKAYDPFIPDKEWPEYVERCSSLSEILSSSSIISLHVHLDDSTKGMIGETEVKKMANGAVIINTSRGALINEQALLDGLNSGKLGGAALDVLAEEIHDGSKNSPLLSYAIKHDNLIITPHIGGATLDSMHNTEEFMVKKLIDRLSKDGIIKP